MIDWTTVAPVIKELFSALALNAPVSPEFQAQWQDARREHVHPEVGKELVLQVTNIAGVGGDERRYENVGSPVTGVRETIVGHRKFTLEVRVNSYDHVQDESTWCWSMIERIRTRLFRARSLAALAAVNVGFVRVAAAKSMSFKQDKRTVNSAVMDVELYAAFTDADPVPHGWIERIELTSKVKDAAGDLLPEPHNVTKELIPPA